MTVRSEHLIDAEDLRHEMAGPNKPVVLDVRWSLFKPDGTEEYREGHIPGAVYVSLVDELSGPGEGAEDGRHPLPDVETLQESVRSWGISDYSDVVAYDDSGSSAAARAWWVLRWAGLKNVRVLDGGLAGWHAARGPLERGNGPEPTPGTAELAGGHLPTLNADEAARLAAEGRLIDARNAERYNGTAEPIDKKAGHIPGAINVPGPANLEGGYIKSARELAQIYSAADFPQSGALAASCGSGITASLTVLALTVAGREAVLFPPSWSGWIADDSRPVEAER